VTLKVKVTPGSPRTEFAGEMADGTLKVRVAAPADKGLANQELCRFLSKHYGGSAEVIQGHTATRKLVRVNRAE
jgi:uncharacterized protein (TIGR00251 family)